MTDLVLAAEAGVDAAETTDGALRGLAPERGLPFLGDDFAEELVGAPAFFLFVFQLAFERDLPSAFFGGEAGVRGGFEYIALDLVPQAVVEVDAFLVLVEELGEFELGLRSDRGGMQRGELTHATGAVANFEFVVDARRFLVLVEPGEADSEGVADLFVARRPGIGGEEFTEGFEWRFDFEEETEIKTRGGPIDRHILDFRRHRAVPNPFRLGGEPKGVADLLDGIAELAIDAAKAIGGGHLLLHGRARRTMERGERGLSGGILPGEEVGGGEHPEEVRFLPESGAGRDLADQPESGRGIAGAEGGAHGEQAEGVGSLVGLQQPGMFLEQGLDAGVRNGRGRFWRRTVFLKASLRIGRDMDGEGGVLRGIEVVFELAD